MAVTGVSFPSLSYQSNPLTDYRQAFMQMAKAIDSGDLSGAQQAYASLSQMQGGNQANGNQSTDNSPFAQALDQIGQDLQNGDITAAQQALNSLKSQMKAHHHGHRHHAAGSSDGVQPSTGSDGPQATGTTGSAVSVLA